MIYTNNDSDEVKWSNGYKLTYEDFQAKEKDTLAVAKYEKSDRKAAAYSNVIISFTGKTVNKRLQIDAFGVFYRKTSWMSQGYRDSKTLRHEQCHFDITEIYSRKFEQAVNEYQDKYGLMVTDEVFKKLNEIIEMCNKAQEDYDQACYSDVLELLFLEKIHKELETTQSK